MVPIAFIKFEFSAYHDSGRVKVKVKQDSRPKPYCILYYEIASNAIIMDVNLSIESNFSHLYYQKATCILLAVTSKTIIIYHNYN